jgi:hypothetical protein
VHLEAGDAVACIVDCNLALDALALKASAPIRPE